jgi:hypothetical protein
MLSSGPGAMTGHVEHALAVEPADASQPVPARATELGDHPVLTLTR